MPRVTEEYRENRRNEILAAAATRFAREGFHATSMADIIGESGLSAGAVYRYFRSKDEIIGAVTELVLATADDVFGELLADGASPSPSEAISTVVHGLVTRTGFRIAGGVDISRVAIQIWGEALRSPEIHERAQDAYGRLRSHFAEVARRRQKIGLLPADADPVHVGAALLGLAQGFLLQHLLLDGTTAADYLAGITALVGSDPA